jgi:hypothetical protein
MEITMRVKKLWAKTNSLQRVLLLSVFILKIFTTFITWYGVIHLKIFKEAEPLTAWFISHFGAFGLLLHTGYALSLIFLFWLIWVFLAGYLTSPKPIMVVPPLLFMCYFVLVTLNLANDLVMLSFRSNVLFALLYSGEFILFLGLMSSIIIAFGPQLFER